MMVTLKGVNDCVFDENRNIFPASCNCVKSFSHLTVPNVVGSLILTLTGTSGLDVAPEVGIFHDTGLVILSMGWYVGTSGIERL